MDTLDLELLRLIFHWIDPRDVKTVCSLQLVCRRFKVRRFQRKRKRLEEEHQYVCKRRDRGFRIYKERFCVPGLGLVEIDTLVTVKEIRITDSVGRLYLYSWQIESDDEENGLTVRFEGHRIRFWTWYNKRRDMELMMDEKREDCIEFEIEEYEIQGHSVEIPRYTGQQEYGICMNQELEEMHKISMRLSKDA